MEILQYFGMAFLGGLILNVMPCVLPVLTLKVFHTIEAFGAAGGSGAGGARTRRLHGLAYAAGTTVAFVIFSTIVVALRASGDVLGWGMHFQHPPFVAALTALIFVFGLNALGVFEVAIASVGSGGDGMGLWGSFANGIFAAIMSTPCTAPFLGTAAGFALAADTAAWHTVLLFGGIGLGLAFPYTLIGFVPGAARLLPRPGKWMETFKHLMGFTLIAASVWLFGALQAQVSPSSANWFLGFLLVLAVALWAMNRFATLRHTALRRGLVRLGLAGAVAVAGVAMIRLEPPQAKAAPAVAAACFDDAPVVGESGIAWRDFDPRIILLETSRNRPVFVDYTADWCAACKTNEKLFLETPTVREALVETGILPVKADMTNEVPVIEQWLGRLELDGKKLSGIPAYAIYLPDQQVEVLPTVITAELVAERLRDVARRYPRLAASN